MEAILRMVEERGKGSDEGICNGQRYKTMKAGMVQNEIET
jgi:hypothetical protein